jgi:hypothetical protein
MTEYYNINYNNDDIDKLDKMARELNNKKTSLCRKVVNDFNENQQMWKDGMDNVVNSQKFSYLPMNKNYNNGLYDETMSAETYETEKTDKTTKSNTDYSMSDVSYASSMSSASSVSSIPDFAKRDNNYFSDTNSMDSFFDDKSIDTYLSNKENKKNVKFNKIVESINYDDCSKDDKNIFEHVKKCNNCKNKLLRFLNNSSDTENKCKFSKIFDENISNVFNL